MTAGELDSIVRMAEPRDAKDLARVYVETWRTTYAGMVPDKVLLEMSEATQGARWARSIERGDELVMVAEDTAKGVIGLSSGGPSRGNELRNGHGCKAEVFTLYILPDEQGRGIGRALLAGMFADFLTRGLGSAIIWVLGANPARFFYEALGGERSIERKERLWGADLPEIAYIWRDLAASLEHDPRLK